MKKVSVVVPIYNVDQYLRDCVDSILRQTYKNIELILVNDGSTDDCGKICDQYKKRCPSIIVVHKSNGGLSSARNAGIMLATGEYLFFVDSDDFVSLDCIKQLVEDAELWNADIVECNMTSDIKRMTDNSVRNIKQFSQYDALTQLLKERELCTSACAKLFKKELFDSISFPEGKIYEDFATIPRIITKVESVVLNTNTMYYYRENPKSITGISFNARRMQYFEVSDELEECLLRVDERYQSLISMRKTRYAISFFKQLCQSNYKDIDTERYLSECVRKHIIKYCLITDYSWFSKLYGILISISTQLAKCIMKI